MLFAFALIMPFLFNLSLSCDVAYAEDEIAKSHFADAQNCKRFLHITPEWGEVTESSFQY